MKLTFAVILIEVLFAAGIAEASYQAAGLPWALTFVYGLVAICLVAAVVSGLGMAWCWVANRRVAARSTPPPRSPLE